MCVLQWRRYQNIIRFSDDELSEADIVIIKEEVVSPVDTDVTDFPLVDVTSGNSTSVCSIRCQLHACNTLCF